MMTVETVPDTEVSPKMASLPQSEQRGQQADASRNGECPRFRSTHKSILMPDPNFPLDPGWSLWSISFVWFVWFVSSIGQKNQRNSTNQRHPSSQTNRWLSRDGMRSHFDCSQNFRAGLRIEFVPIKAEKDPCMQGLDGGVRVLFQD